MVDDRRDDGDDDRHLDAGDDDGRRGEHRDEEFVAAHGQNRSQAANVDEFDADEEHDGRQHGQGQAGERPGQGEQDLQHDCRGGELSELAAAAGAVDHLGFGGAAVDDECAGERCGDVGAGQPDEVAVLIEGLVVPCRVGPRGRRALREDDDEHGRCGADDGHHVVPTERGQLRMWQAARHRAEHSDAVTVEVQQSTGCDRADDGEKRAGDTPGEEPEAEHYGDDSRRYGGRGPAD